MTLKIDNENIYLGKATPGEGGVDAYTKEETDELLVDKLNTNANNFTEDGVQMIKDIVSDDFATKEELVPIEEKIAEIEAARFVNATVMGEPTILQGQVSGFSTASYLIFPTILDFHNQAFEFEFAFTPSDNVQVQQNILDSRFGLALAIKNGKGLMAISTNGTEWDAGQAIGTFDIQANTTHYARVSWNRLQYKTQITTTKGQYTDDMIIVNTTRPFPATMYIGGCNTTETGHEPHPFLGTINMNEAKLYVNNQLVWQGMDDVGLDTRLDLSVSNINSVGKQKIIDIMGGVKLYPITLTEYEAIVEKDPSVLYVIKAEA